MSIYDLLKDLASVLKEAGKIEQYKQILEITSKLFELQNEKNNLKQENEKLKNERITTENLIFEKNMYYLIEEDQKHGPFCTCCWDSNSKLIRLHVGDQGALCPFCKTYTNYRNVSVHFPFRPKNLER